MTGASLAGGFAVQIPNDAPAFFEGGFDHFGRGFGGGYTNEDLANALGISVDELNAAYQKANDAAIDQAVQAGLITQAQADQLRSKGSAFPIGGLRGDWLSQNGIDYDALLANALGITKEKLQAAYTQAYNARIDQAVTDGKLTQEQADLMKGQHALFSSESFRSSMQSAYEAAVKKAVADGVITQAQADAILKNGNGMDFPGLKGPGGFGGFERPGPHGGWGDTPPSNPEPPSAPPATPSSGL
jgi:polyhydroxyalkanoate synthesis regulator phasin